MVLSPGVAACRVDEEEDMRGRKRRIRVTDGVTPPHKPHELQAHTVDGGRRGVMWYEMTSHGVATS